MNREKARKTGETKTEMQTRVETKHKIRIQKEKRRGGVEMQVSGRNLRKREKNETDT